ncbi:uncharacterized protein K441DRAFT_674931 [Cenococcum geophilum 1.58]|uniref:uncharacterized protein n=1 Tax=Cenococcum geophilum 1.58 TaxID=794803 RepID=UPI00358F3495|nr:hypothetical protein K441DRAFT_674931 [Cenococcum geophilum 1.58]
MSLPKPLVELNGHCSVINNHTLYVYSPDAFQALDLSEGAKWKELPMGVSVTGGKCVKAVPAGGGASQAMLYIVGGVVNETASSWNYPGLQRFSFANRTWEWVTPVTQVTQNRQNHAATYLNASSSILVYSGSQTTGDTGPSSQTFLISTTPPFSVQAFGSIAPPTVDPMLMPWDESHAVMIGGDSQNKAVWTFSPEQGWQNVGVTLIQGIANQSRVRCTVVSGDDGSKVLETYDMSVNPNVVTRVALLNAGGAVASPGQTVGGPSTKQKRDLTINGWPSYNGTLAPTSARSGFSIAQDANGLAVISGGNTEDPLCIFDQRANSWLNATELLGGSQVTIQSEPTSSVSSSSVPSATSTSYSSAAASSTAATVAPVAATGPSKARMLTVLGATLGAIFGIAALLIILLLLLRWKRERRKRAGKGGYVEKDRLSFADRGAEFMSEAGGAVGHNYSASMNASQSSLAIIAGRAGLAHKRGLGPLGSDASTAGLVTKKSPLGYAEPVEMSQIVEKAPPATEKQARLATQPLTFVDATPTGTTAALSRSRSSGWSRYFANNEATNLAHMPSGRSTYTSDRTSAGSQSHYTDSRIISQPQTAPPLEIFTKFDGQRLSRVATGSPTLGHSRENLPGQPMQAELARASSAASSVLSLDANKSTAYTSTRDPATSWTPVSGPEWNQRPPSSAYTNSVRASEVRDGTSSYYATDGASSYFPTSGPSSLNPGRFGAAEERDSTVTVFPRGVPDTGGGPKKGAGHQDMSWINLGAGAP